MSEVVQENEEAGEGVKEVKRELWCGEGLQKTKASLIGKWFQGLTTSVCIAASENVKQCHLAVSSRGWTSEQASCEMI